MSQYMHYRSQKAHDRAKESASATIDWLLMLADRTENEEALLKDLQRFADVERKQPQSVIITVERERIA